MHNYRIGDYARYMGVTPDLLKHYEKLGLIHSERSESGYRYYPFHTSSVLIECIRLRNYGMTLKEISNILSGKDISNAVVAERMQENLELLRQEADFDQLLIEDYSEFVAFSKMLEGKKSDWTIRYSHGMYFLPHTNGDGFLQDRRIYEVLKEWMADIPIVKSVMRTDRQGFNTWGFAVKEEHLKPLRLPINPIVTYVPPQKMLMYHFQDHAMALQEETPDNKVHPAMMLLDRLGFEVNGPYYRISMLPSNWAVSVELQYGYYAIPVTEKS